MSSKGNGDSGLSFLRNFFCHENNENDGAELQSLVNPMPADEISKVPMARHNTEEDERIAGEPIDLTNDETEHRPNKNWMVDRLGMQVVVTDFEGASKLTLNLLDLSVTLQPGYLDLIEAVDNELLSSRTSHNKFDCKWETHCRDTIISKALGYRINGFDFMQLQPERYITDQVLTFLCDEMKRAKESDLVKHGNSENYFWDSTQIHGRLAALTDTAVMQQVKKKMKRCGNEVTVGSFRRHYFIVHVCVDGTANKKNHYVAFVGDNATREISEYDPNGHKVGNNELNHGTEGIQIARLMAQGTGTKTTEWKLQPHHALAHNTSNGCDCGIYAFLFAQLHSRNQSLPNEIDFAARYNLRTKIKYLLMHRAIAGMASVNNIAL